LKKNNDSRADILKVALGKQQDLQIAKARLAAREQKRQLNDEIYAEAVADQEQKSRLSAVPGKVAILDATDQLYSADYEDDTFNVYNQLKESNYSR